MTPDDLDARLAALTTAILGPLRATKDLDHDALRQLRDLVVEVAAGGAFAEAIPTELAGRLWFVHYAMLDEATHAAEPFPIQVAAAAYQETLRTELFGPWFGRRP